MLSQSPEKGCLIYLTLHPDHILSLPGIFPNLLILRDYNHLSLLQWNPRPFNINDGPLVLQNLQLLHVLRFHKSQIHLVSRWLLCHMLPLVSYRNCNVSLCAEVSKQPHIHHSIIVEINWSLHPFNGAVSGAGVHHYCTKSGILYKQTSN